MLVCCCWALFLCCVCSDGSCHGRMCFVQGFVFGRGFGCQGVCVKIRCCDDVVYVMVGVLRLDVVPTLWMW